MKRIATSLLLCCGLWTTVYAQNMENTAISVGQIAPNLKYPTPDGKTLDLSTISKDKVILLDFWASWCRPCRTASPRLVALYEKYKDQKFPSAKNGFTIVSVSMDKSKEAWIAAIEKDKLTWDYHMSDLGAWDSEPAAIYGVQFIPQAFLIGPDGKILAKYNFPEEADADLAKMLK